LEVLESPFTSETFAGAGGFRASPPDAAIYCHRHIPHFITYEIHTHHTSHKPNQTPSILEIMSENGNKERDEKLAEEPVNNPAERTLTPSDDARVVPSTILSTNSITPHKKSHSLTPWNRTHVLKDGSRHLRRISETSSWRMSQGLSKRAYMSVAK
jgi:hypothetical protein